MKKVITAINNPKLNEELKKEKNFEIIGKDIQYKEAILEILEKNTDIDLIILSEKISGEIRLDKLIERIKLIKEDIKIIFILEKEDNEIEKILIKNSIVDIYYNNKINLNELINIINKKEINMEEEIIKLKKIIKERNIEEKDAEENNYKNSRVIINLKNKCINQIKKYLKYKKNHNKSRNMSTKIITFFGNYKSGKSTLSLIISQYLSDRNYSVLLVDGDFEKKDLSIILKKDKKRNYKKRKNKLKNTINNKIKINYKKKLQYYYLIKSIIHLFTNKINKNLYFFNKLDYLLNHKKSLNEKKIKKILLICLTIMKQHYDFIIIDLSKTNIDTINQVILKNSNVNFLLIEANMLGIKEIQKSLKTYLKKWKINKKSFHIISNKKNFTSINKKLISNCIFSKNKIYEIKENKIYFHIINHFFRKKFLLKNKNIKKDINKIIYNVIIK